MKQSVPLYIVIVIMVMSLILCYLLATFFVMGVSWVTGHPPAHIMPGMTPYETWNIH